MPSFTAPYISCPHCNTVFVTPAELPAHGKVRCGVCNGVLEAQLHGLDQLPGEPVEQSLDASVEADDQLDADPNEEITQSTGSRHTGSDDTIAGRIDLDEFLIDESLVDGLEGESEETQDLGSALDDQVGEEETVIEPQSGGDASDDADNLPSDPAAEKDFDRGTGVEEVIDLAALVGADTETDNFDDDLGDLTFGELDSSGLDADAEVSIDLATMLDDESDADADAESSQWVSEESINEGGSLHREAEEDESDQFVVANDDDEQLIEDELEASVAADTQVSDDSGPLPPVSESDTDVDEEEVILLDDDEELADVDEIEDQSADQTGIETDSASENPDEEDVILLEEDDEDLDEELADANEVEDQLADQPDIETDASPEIPDEEEVILLDEDDEQEDELAEALSEEDQLEPDEEDQQADRLFAQAGDGDESEWEADEESIDAETEASAEVVDEVSEIDEGDRDEIIHEQLDLGQQEQEDDPADIAAEDESVVVDSEELSDEALRPVRRSRWWLVANVSISLMLLALIVGLALYLVREPLKDHPVVRPWQESLCGVIGCELPQRRDSSLLGAVAKVVISHPKYLDALRIDLSLQNRADFAQPFPTIRLLFLDELEHPVAGRDFLPEEYLIGPLAGKTLMQPMVPEQIVLEIKDPGAEAVSYRFSYF